MVALKTIRQVEVRYESTGADKMKADADKVASSQERMGQATEHAATVTERASQRQLSASKAYDKVMGSLDQAFRARQQYERQETTINRAFNQGVIDAEQRSRDLVLASTRLAERSGTSNDNDPARRGLSTYDKQFIKYQGFDVASSLGSGAGLGTVAFQQGPQVLQQLADREGGLKAGLKELGVSALGLVTPMTVAGTAVAGLGIAFGVAASQASKDREILEKATQGMGAGTGATVSQLDALALRNAEAGKVSASTSREIVAGYASIGTLALPIIGDLTRLTAEYARQTGQDAATATSELGRAFSDLGSGLDTIGSRMGGLGDATRQLIQAQIEQGDRSGAQQTAADALKASVDANAAATTGWASAWNTATAAANGYWEAAKRIAGIKLGVAPEGAAEAVARLQGSLDFKNELRRRAGMDAIPINDPLNTQLGTARVIADQQRMEAEGRAAEQRAKLASETAGKLTRADDPNIARLAQLRQERFDLGDALSDPLARSKLGDTGAVDAAYRARIRAIETLTDAEGNLIGKQELSRRQDQLRLDAANAVTAAQKASVAERQKSFDLIGKPLTNSEARDQIGSARALALAQESGSKGGKGASGRADAQDEFDRALKSADDRIRRQEQEAATYGMGAEAVARYRVETDLLAAAKRADRDITPTLTAQVQDYANKAAEAAARTEDLRDRMRTVDQVRGMGSDGIRSIITDLQRGASAADLMNNATSRLASSFANMASDQIAEGFLGKRGSSGGVFSLFGSGLGSAAANSPLPGAQGPTMETGGFLATIKGLFGYADGGFTGYGARMEPAGIVHRGEYVFDAAATARIGLSNLEAMRSTRRGWADGGYVGKAPDWTPQSAPSGGGPVTLQIVNNGTPQEVQQVEEKRDGNGGRTIIAQTKDLVAQTLNQPGSARDAARGAANNRPVRR